VPKITITIEHDDENTPSLIDYIDAIMMEMYYTTEDRHGNPQKVKISEIYIDQEGGYPFRHTYNAEADRRKLLQDDIDLSGLEK